MYGERDEIPEGKANRPKRPTGETPKKLRKRKTPKKPEKVIPPPPEVRFDTVFQTGKVPTRYRFVTDENVKCTCGASDLPPSIPFPNDTQHAESCARLATDADTDMLPRVMQELREEFKGYDTEVVALIPPIRKISMSEEYNAHVHVLSHAIYDVGDAIANLGIDGLNIIFPATIGLDFCLYTARPFEFSFIHTESQHADYCVMNHELLLDDFRDDLVHAYQQEIDYIAGLIYAEAYYNQSGDLIAACAACGLNARSYSVQHLETPNTFEELSDYIVEYIMVHVTRCVYRAIYELVKIYRDVSDRYFNLV